MQSVDKRERVVERQSVDNMQNTQGRLRVNEKKGVKFNCVDEGSNLIVLDRLTMQTRSRGLNFQGIVHE